MSELLSPSCGLLLQPTISNQSVSPLSLFDVSASSFA